MDIPSTSSVASGERDARGALDQRRLSRALGAYDENGGQRHVDARPVRLETISEEVDDETRK